jgi:alkanesulfonate monooxygenase SsuD/methylene tetrahydromethanopterin reductase-like flavin-dependent oxidoreductase (luciferase family)
VVRRAPADIEIIGSPEIFIAAAERTKHIRLGSGVTSLPYHHPWLVADGWVLLDQLIRGRAILGAGPGALPSDAFVMGIDLFGRAGQAMLNAITAHVDEQAAAGGG